MCNGKITRFPILGISSRGHSAYNINPFQQLGMQFTATGSGTLSQVNLALSSNGGGSPVVTVEFYADSGNTLGALLATGTTTIGGPFPTAHPSSVSPMSAATNAVPEPSSLALIAASALTAAFVLIVRGRK